MLCKGISRCRWRPTVLAPALAAGIPHFVNDVSQDRRWCVLGSIEQEPAFSGVVAWLRSCTSDAGTTGLGAKNVDSEFGGIISK